MPPGSPAAAGQSVGLCAWTAKPLTTRSPAATRTDVGFMALSTVPAALNREAAIRHLERLANRDDIALQHADHKLTRRGDLVGAGFRAAHASVFRLQL